MEQLSVVFLCGVVLYLLYLGRQHEKREDRFIAGIKELAYSQMEPLKVALQHVRTMHDIAEKQAELLLKVSEAAPQKTSIEVQRMQLAFEVDRTAAESELLRSKIARPQRDEPIEPPSAIPTSQTTLE